MKSVVIVIKEQFKHFYLIRRLSLYDIKSKNRNNYLGMAWEIINPSIQLLIYWFVFGTIRSRAPIEVSGELIPFFPWLVAGFFVWTFCYQGVIQGSKSIYTRLRMLSKMNFPMSVIPNISIFSNLYIHFILIIIASLLLQIMGYPISFYYIQLGYYVFATISLIFSISLITSTLSTIMRDFHMLLNAIFRMFLYVSGVLWPITLLEKYPTVLEAAKLNPIFYLIEGYRAALFGVEWHFITQWKYTIYFWILVFILLLIGSFLHLKFRRHFIDYL